MTPIIVTFHVIFCVLLILIVLLQSGKGAGMGMSLGGGGGQALFGAAGPATLLAKITTAVAVLFMVTSLTLAYLSGHQSETSIMKQTSAPMEQTQTSAPVEQTPTSAPVEQTQTSGQDQSE